jgi:fatty-acyl-CoA synthase
MRGAAFLVSDGFVPARTLQRLGDPALGVSHYFCVPQMAAALRAEPGYDPRRLNRLKAIFTGGAPHPAAAIRAWLADGIPVADGFGMTETGTVFGMPLDPAIIDRKAGSAGIATPRVETRIVDEAGNDCAAGQPGELLIRGANVTAGYWRRPEETAAAFTAGGWFRTGDIARADEDGFHFLVDRRKDMFISGGENVYPAEIEAVAAEHPSVAECALVGVADMRWGEAGHLFVVAVPGATLDPATILAHLGARLARYKLPKHVTFLDSLPRNGAGKLMKAELRRRAAESPS